MKVLVVDDERAVRDSLRRALELEGYDVELAADGEEALYRLGSNGDPDVVILDVLMPGLDGLEVCRRVRSKGSRVPILMLTARTSEVDRVVGLDAGADDYIVKPFSMPELISRVRAMFRRRELDREDSRQGVRRVGGLEIDLAAHAVQVDGRRVRLTPSELRLLSLLSSRPGHVFSRRELMSHLWDSSFVGDERAADVHVANLRRKIEDDPKAPERLVTVRGAGYMLAEVV
jgi:two-component system response regulator RegX3